MDEDMSFPNPVERHDLPVKKARWPKVVAVLAVAAVLGVAFLPQILHTAIGRRLVRSRLESKYAGAEVLLGSFRTSWFGGTSAQQFWVKGSDGRVVGCAAFSSDRLSLWKLLRGRYDLGHCAIDGLVLEYVLDSGDVTHRDTYERLTGAPARTAATPPAALAKLSGQITLTHSQGSLARYTMQAGALTTSFQQAKFWDVAGKFDIPSLDQPWTYELKGSVGLNGDERGQTFETAGTVRLGQGGLLVPTAIKADLTVRGQNVPTDLVAVLVPLFEVSDCRTAFGDTFDRVDASLTGDGGVLTLDLREAASARGHARLRPTLDLRVHPSIVLIDAATAGGGDANVIACALPQGPARAALETINPFLVGVTDAMVTAHITATNVPMARTWTSGTAAATVEVTNWRFPEAVGRPAARNAVVPLLRQLAPLTGEYSPTPRVRCEPEHVTLSNGVVTVSPPARIEAEQSTLELSGSATVDGKLAMTLSVTSPPLAGAMGQSLAGDLPLRVPLVGTSAAPKLDVEAALRPLPEQAVATLKDWMARQASDLRQKDVDAAKREKERQVRESLRPFTTSENEDK